MSDLTAEQREVQAWAGASSSREAIAAGVEVNRARMAPVELKSASRLFTSTDSSQRRRSAIDPRPVDSGSSALGASVLTQKVGKPSARAGARSRMASFPTIKSGPSGQPN